MLSNELNQIDSQEKKQIDLETEQHELGLKRYREELSTAKEKGIETTLLPQRILLIKTINSVSKRLDQLLDPSNEERKPKGLDYIKDVDTKVIAFITCSEIINALSLGRTALETELGIARGIMDYIQLEEFKLRSPGLYTYAVNKVKESGHQKYKRNSLRHYANYAGVDNEGNREKNVLLGSFLLEVFIQETGLVSKENIHTKGKTKQIIKAADETVEWLEEKHNQSELLQPWYLPMVVPPYQWTTPFDGGYRTFTLPFIKGFKTKDLEDYQDKHDLSTVYKAVNAVQDTAWKINTEVLNILNDYWIDEVDTVVLPKRQPHEIPQLPCLNEEVDEYKAKYPNEWAQWKQRVALLHVGNERAKSKRITVDRKIWMANKFKDEPTLYFVHTVDFRGRVYPVVPMLNPQSDDLGKALLEFAYGEEIGEQGDYWLKIHMANTYGIDKESMDDRVKWTEEHEAQIQMVALDPKSYRGFWEEADSPWQFLAACFEYNRYKESGLGAKFVSTLPIGLDGSCNGIQHFSAMLRDEVGGQAVNLTPQKKPADVYLEVAKKVEEELLLDDDPLSLAWRGKVSRSLVKRQVMTLPYGSTLFGMRDQLKEEMKAQADKGKPVLDVLDPKDEWKLICYLTNVIWKSIKETLVASVTMMDWLKEIARLISDNGHHIEWTTPVGFRVRQYYKKTENIRIDATYMNIRIQRRLTPTTNELYPRKQISGISPNMVHSMDAAHMMATVNRLLNKGVVDFSMVHDSFAVHLGHVETLAEELRDTFIEQYNGEFIKEFHKQLELNHQQELPSPPPLGQLDLNLIKDSRYFFN